jgi:hypothetical protein
VSPVPRPSVQLSFWRDNIVKDENWNLTDETFAVFYDRHSCNAGPSDDEPLVEQTKCPIFVTTSTIVWVSTSTSTSPVPLASSAAQGMQDSEELAVCPFFFLSFVILSSWGLELASTARLLSVDIDSSTVIWDFDQFIIHPASFPSTYHPIRTLFKYLNG